MKKNLKPGYIEYRSMHDEFRPFVMFTNADNYKTSIVLLRNSINKIQRLI